MVTRTGLLITLLIAQISLVSFSPAFAQSGGSSPSGSLDIPPPLFEPVPVVDFRDDKLLTEITAHASFSWSMKTLGEDIAEAFTFNPLEKAELKLKHAEERQREIDHLDFNGEAIPIEYEERRVQKLNEASTIINSNWKDNRYELSDFTFFDEEYKLLRNMGELNDVKVLYSQLPRIMQSGDEVKERYNEKVNSLQTWQDFCHGEFDVDTLGTMRTAVDRLEVQCPELVVLQERYGTDRLQKIVKGTI